MNKRGNPSWQKGGKSPNPSGRPKEFIPFRAICTPAMDELARKALEYHLKKKTAKVVMWYYDQKHGKAPQPVTGEDGGPIKVNIVQDVPVDD